MDAHERLLQRWEALAGCEIVLDGIFDAAGWQSAPIRILFVLKDAYDSEHANEGWDLRKYARQQGNKGVTLREMSYWCHTLLRPEYDHPCGDEETLHEALLSSASINVKKTPGSTYANSGEIAEHANVYGDLLLEQIDIINPNVVICGSTWWAIKDLVQSSADGTSNSRIFKTQNGRTYIDFCHPANRFPRLMNCATLTELYRRADCYQTHDKSHS